MKKSKLKFKMNYLNNEAETDQNRHTVAVFSVPPHAKSSLVSEGKHSQQATHSLVRLLCRFSSLSLCLILLSLCLRSVGLSVLPSLTRSTIGHENLQIITVGRSECTPLRCGMSCFCAKYWGPLGDNDLVFAIVVSVSVSVFVWVAVRV